MLPAASSASSGGGWEPRYSSQSTSTRNHFGVAAPRLLPASASAWSSLARASGRIATPSRSQGSSSSAPSPPAASFTSAASARTVSTLARATQAASSSPRASGTMVSALRGLTAPERTASRSSGRSARFRASRSSFWAVLPESPSRSRA